MPSFNWIDSIPDSSVCIMFWDTTYPEEQEDKDASSNLKKSIEKELRTSLEDVDIYPGASGPAWLLETIVSGMPIAIAISFFFSGKLVNDNLNAWRNLASTLKGLLGRKACLSRSAAAILALDAVLEHHSDTNVREIKLLKYSTADSRFETFEDARETNKSLPIEYAGVIIHVFDIQVDCTQYLVVVDGTEVGLKRV